MRIASKNPIMPSALLIRLYFPVQMKKKKEAINGRMNAVSVEVRAAKQRKRNAKISQIGADFFAMP